MGTLGHKHRKKGNNKTTWLRYKNPAGERQADGGAEAWTGEVVDKGVYFSLEEQPATHDRVKGIGGA